MNTLPNRNPETGIRYGYISANSLDPDILHDLMYGLRAKDLSRQEALVALDAELENEANKIEEDARTALDHRLLASQFWNEQCVEKAYHHLGFDGRENFIASRREEREAHIQIDEPIIEGELDGVKYHTSWLGGALHLWVFFSPRTAFFRECSPCVPGAGNLDCPDVDGVLTYDVPFEWRASE